MNVTPTFANCGVAGHDHGREEEKRMVYRRRKQGGEDGRKGRFLVCGSKITEDRRQLSGPPLFLIGDAFDLYRTSRASKLS